MARFARSRRWLAGIPMLSLLVGCRGDVGQRPEPAEYPGSFRIEKLSETADPEGTTTTWLATAPRGTRVAKFRIQLLVKAPKGDAPIVFTTGALIREPNQDGSSFLGELADVLKASAVPRELDRTERLDFATAILGTSLSRQAGPDMFAGGFTSSPAGGWIATKVFVADGEGEFFLNLNPAAGVGEISIKDEDYGDVVIAELARVLAPE